MGRTNRAWRGFSVPGAWLPENIEPKATLRAIIDADEWYDFRQHILDQRHEGFTSAFTARLQTAVADGRIHADVLRLATGPPESVTMESKDDDSTPERRTATA